MNTTSPVNTYAPARVSGMAITALVLSLSALILWAPAYIGLPLAMIAAKRIYRSGGQVVGMGMAQAAMIISGIIAGLPFAFAIVVGELALIQAVVHAIAH